jgi:hypothetical protein
MPENKTYTGGCHCGRVRYEVTTDLAMVGSCNCSICQKRGALWAFAPAEQFKLTAGEDNLADYQFAKRVIHHLFCKTCGVGSFSRGQSPEHSHETIAINVRCLDDIDLAALTLTPFDGKSL